MTRPLLLTRDPDLLDDMRRISVAAGIEPDIVTSAADGRRLWTSASVVVVGDDLVEETVRAGLRRRDDVLVATATPGSDVPWRGAVALGAVHVVELPEGEGFLVERLAAGGRDAVARARVIGVVGGAGGCGASVVTASLAIASARRGLDPVLVDADPGSGGIDLVLGCEETPGARWSDLASVTGLLAPDALREALPSVEGIHVLSVDRASGAAVPVTAVPAVVDSAMSATSVLLLDLPRAHPDLLESLVARCDDVLLVTTLDVRGATSGLRLSRWLRARARTGLVARHVPHSSLDADELGTWLALEVAAELPHDRRLASAVERGDVRALARPSRYARAVDALLAALVAA
jgi:secretion/DNA translocation related CpaE-like protein